MKSVDQFNGAFQTLIILICIQTVNLILVIN